MVDECHLAGPVAFVHATDLRHGHVRLVDDADHVLGEVVDQGIGRLAGLATVHVTGIVLDARTVAHVLEHLKVIGGPLGQALGL